MIAITSRNSAETMVPIMLPRLRNDSRRVLSAIAVAAMATDASTTTVECPSEKKNPMPRGRRPSCINLRVTLSMAAMWSASMACRSPSP